MNRTLRSQNYVKIRLWRNPEDQTTRTVQSEHKIVVEKSPEDHILRTDPPGQPIKTVTQSQQSSLRRTNHLVFITPVIATSEESPSIHHNGHRNVGRII